MQFNGKANKGLHCNPHGLRNISPRINILLGIHKSNICVLQELQTFPDYMYERW